MRPLPFMFSNRTVVYGHYKVCQRSGAIAATPAALDDWARVRWVPAVSNAKFVLCSLRAGITVITAITTTVQVVLQASIVRTFTSDYTTAITNASMVAGSNRMAGNMASSLMGTAGPGICTTAPMTTFTGTLDTTPFGYVIMNPLLATNATGTAILQAVGTAMPMATLYEWKNLGDHPPVLSNGEGIVVETLLAGHATGTIALHTEWVWCETLNPFGND